MKDSDIERMFSLMEGKAANYVFFLKMLAIPLGYHTLLTEDISRTRRENKWWMAKIMPPSGLLSCISREWPKRTLPQLLLSSRASPKLTTIGSSFRF